MKFISSSIKCMAFIIALSFISTTSFATDTSSFTPSASNNSDYTFTSERANEYLIKVAPTLLNNALSNSANFGISSEMENAENFVIGHALPVYNHFLDKAPNNYTHCFPVFNNKKAIGIFTVTEFNGNFTAYFGVDFAKQLNDYQFKDFKIYYDTEKNQYNLHAVTSVDNLSLPQTNDSNLADTKSSPFTEVESSLYPILSNSIDTINIREVLTYNSYSSPYNSKTLPVKIVLQRGNTCWAAAASAVIEYKTGKNISIEQLCREQNVSQDGDGSATNVASSLTIHSVPSIFAYVPTNSEKINQINSNKPMLAYWTSGDAQHATVICGYTASSYALALTMMDPNYPYYRSVTSSSENGWYFYEGAYNSTQYEWVAAQLLQ